MNTFCTRCQHSTWLTSIADSCQTQLLPFMRWACVLCHRVFLPLYAQTLFPFQYILIILASYCWMLNKTFWLHCRGKENTIMTWLGHILLCHGMNASYFSILACPGKNLAFTTNACAFFLSYLYKYVFIFVFVPNTSP